ncbi:MAG: hypothetical protein A2126_03230 [Candidatus Woykebacteria bacterium GWB1_45_5]|uniref:Uncharacterized protein n=2 Tax=Candidatus Woykeibacteriota TaxID=1817899 RepID=A0A1G1W1Y5_9BACT|nr:MAG: hypothetical protein A2113_03725 [Candidatus Woykebacteria bacterium GWA1_44_8]OGY23590.1 MAG: hypothetical protein A2126_03230 [Candidatus Woykebacteria bacterium GWB1_45_5]
MPENQAVPIQSDQPKTEQFPSLEKKKSKKWLWILLSTILILILIGVGVWLLLKNPPNPTSKESGEQATSSAKPISKGDSKIIYSKLMLNQPTNRAGIWDYDLKTKKERQLLSFFDLVAPSKNISEKVSLYGNTVLSPDKTKVAFYVGLTSQDPKSHIDIAINGWDLWFYDLVKGEKKKLLSGASLYSGYIQEPVWSLDSKSLYITLNREGRNDLFSIDLSGNSKNLAQGNFFWPKIIDDNTLVYNTSLPKTNEIGIFNLESNTHYTISDPTSAYLMMVKKLENNYLIKASYPDLVFGYGGKPELIDKQNILGLEKINLKTHQVEKIKIPSSLSLDPAVKRIQPISFCNNNWVTLGSVQNDIKSGEKYTSYYAYNIQKESVQQLLTSPSNTMTPTVCNFKMPNELIYSDGGAKVITYDLTNQRELGVKDYSQIITKSDGCLYDTYNYHNPSNIGGDVIYLNRSFGGVVCSPPVATDKQGIYRVDLRDKSFIQISYDRSDEEDQILLVEE